MIISKIIIGERIDKFLGQYLAEYSRSAIQKKIADGFVTVNGNQVTKKYILQEDDVLDINDNDLVIPEGFLVKPNDQVKVDVIEETEDYIVVNKPAGLITHPGDTHLVNDTLVNGLLARFPEIEQVGDDEMRPGIVHRIDKDVSGVMVIARNSEMFNLLKQQFKDRKVYKKYLALAHGVFTEKHGVITFDLARSKRNRTKMAAMPPGQGKTAISEYEVIQQFQHYALVSVLIHTGRTHQIRAHLNAIGHPLIGDDIYKPKNMASRLQPGRIFLHASDISFIDQNNVKKSYNVPLTKSLQVIIDDLYSTI
ncbi:MAG: RluA family pseudouridine synthase [bacterium]|nr:RluA family pseudouridine synthase [bacterium]